MARTSAIISLVVVFVLAVVLNTEVQASQCMTQCNRQCLKSQNPNGVSCGVQCFVQCIEAGQKNQLSEDVKAKIANLKQKASSGAINKNDVDEELREIALHMMMVSEVNAHHHEHKFGEKPVKAPAKTVNEDDDDITDDDDVPDARLHH